MPSIGRGKQCRKRVLALSCRRARRGIMNDLHRGRGVIGGPKTLGAAHRILGIHHTYFRISDSVTSSDLIICTTVCDRLPPALPDGPPTSVEALRRFGKIR